MRKHELLDFLNLYCATVDIRFLIKETGSNDFINEGIQRGSGWFLDYYEEDFDFYLDRIINVDNVLNVYVVED